MLIEAGEPATWRDLEKSVAQILDECGLQVESPKKLETARGSIEVDVYARDTKTTPDSVCLCECKHWGTNVPKTVVHSFRTVVVDSGANTGLIISKLGFQPGAEVAAEHSNIRLLAWAEFQDLFADRWFVNHMAPLARTELDPLFEYTEPINSRIFRKADKLPAQSQARFKELRQEHHLQAFLFMPLLYPMPRITEGPMTPPLPLRSLVESDAAPAIEGLPSDILDTEAIRPFFEAVFRFSEGVIAELDDVFGERA